VLVAAVLAVPGATWKTERPRTRLRSTVQNLKKSRLLSSPRDASSSTLTAVRTWLTFTRHPTKTCSPEQRDGLDGSTQVRHVAPDLLECADLTPSLECAEAQALCAAAAASCECCDAQFCNTCFADSDAFVAHGSICAAQEVLRSRWPKIVATPRFRLFLKALGVAVMQSGNEPTAVVDGIRNLCCPRLPADNLARARAAWRAEMTDPLATLHCALVRRRLAGADQEPAARTSAAITELTEWCSIDGYLAFERRVATNAHGLRFSSPAASVLANAVAASAADELSPSAEDALLWAVAGVGNECELPFYSATAIFAQASALNHSCDPSVEVVSCTRAELRLRTTRALRVGDELSLAYISREQRALHAAPRGRDGGRAAIRAELLERYGFLCDCEVCAKASCFDLLSSHLIQHGIMRRLDARSLAMFARTCSLHRQLVRREFESNKTHV
jgi:hypothetical protein